MKLHQEGIIDQYPLLDYPLNNLLFLHKISCFNLGSLLLDSRDFNPTIVILFFPNEFSNAEYLNGFLID